MAKLHPNLNKPVAPTQLERDVALYIDQAADDGFAQAIEGDDRWPVFFHLAETRHALLDWADFGAGCRLLEVGGGFGALTGLFCRRCASVTVTEQNSFCAEALYRRHAEWDNLEIYAADVQEVTFSHKYDVIILVGQLDQKREPMAFLAHLESLLAPGGRLFVAVENRYGLKYWAGIPDKHTKLPLGGIRGHRGLGRRQLDELLAGAGFGMRKFYYPYPDHLLPQVLFTDARPPDAETLINKIFPYVTDNATQLFGEKSIYQDLAKEGVAPFFANGFLVECANQVLPSPVVYATSSTDRPAHCRYATCILEDGRVTKAPLHPDSAAGLAALAQNLEELAERGIGVVPHELQNGQLVMPCIQSDTLWTYMSTTLASNTEAVTALYDRLYEAILASSEYLSPDQSAFCRAHPGLDFGPVLKKAYIEMIPVNCFFQDGQLLFFDQEFSRAAFPAAYVMLRALIYFPFSRVPGLSLEAMKRRYKLAAVWDILEREEKQFIQQVRSQQLYANFYSWTTVSPQQLEANARRLAGGTEPKKALQLDKPWEQKLGAGFFEEEVRCGYTVDTDTKCLWAVELDLLEQLMQVCQKHGLRYFAVFGTLLGAVRHGGFIPWDDDIDIALPRQDFDRLCALAPKEFAEPYFLQTPENDPECFFGSPRLRNSQTTFLEKEEPMRFYNKGIGIDILPLDGICATTWQQKRQASRVRRAKAKLTAHTANGRYDDYQYEFVPESWRARWRKNRRVSRAELCRQLYAAQTVCNAQTARYLGFVGNERSGALERSVFAESTLMPFEHLMIPVPVGYQAFIRQVWGENTLPAAGLRRPSHGGFIDTRNPFTMYETPHYRGVFDGVEPGKIVLFGAGNMLGTYLKNHGEIYPPACLFDNDPAKWGHTVRGIQVKNPAELPKYIDEGYRLIIVNIYHEEIGKQLEKMEIREYYIYIEGKLYR